MDHELFNPTTLLAPSPEHLASVKVFPLIPAIKKKIIKTIDSPLSWDQLTASDVSFSIVRPIVFKFARPKDLAIVYACLVVRSYFLGESENDLAYAGGPSFHLRSSHNLPPPPPSAPSSSAG
ncbi:hypothetical protein F5050DRAFT_703501 [Lentinula boryana]|uniref:Uncharacterized protein n=1 Tax=Lentinula boryana TaxID=40481 RepID=A0ABQ8QNP4_9AGAR|nr:hypothetical protein F5050DRAFT_703501 [Lentinula boryana]